MSRLPAILCALLLTGCGLLVREVERIGNPASTSPPYVVSSAAGALHDSLIVADLHADTLLSSRDLGRSSDIGHLDLPRLRRGRVGLQVFGIVTNMPLCPEFLDCGRKPNLVAVLAAAAGWPLPTWFSDQARALHQANRMRTIADNPGAGFRLLRDRSELVDLMSAPSGPADVGVVLAVEGAQSVGDDVAGVDALFNAGVRVLGLAHYFDNAVAGSAHGRKQGGITTFGWHVLRRARALGMVIDLAHASPAAINAVLDAMPDVPVMVSHTGIKAVCGSDRNLDDVLLRKIIRAGGLIGVGAWTRALCLDPDASAADFVARMIKSINYVVTIAEQEHPGHGTRYVALGSDFDGWVPVGFDAGGWALLTQGLMTAARPYTDTAIARIMSGNVCAFLTRALPGPPASVPTDPCGP